MKPHSDKDTLILFSPMVKNTPLKSQGLGNILSSTHKKKGHQQNKKGRRAPSQQKQQKQKNTTPLQNTVSNSEKASQKNKKIAKSKFIYLFSFSLMLKMPKRKTKCCKDLKYFTQNDIFDNFFFKRERKTQNDTFNFE